MGRFVSTLACLILGGLAGCMSDAKLELPPMPKMLPGAPPETKPAPTTAEVIKTAVASAGKNDAPGVARALETLPAETRGGATRDLFVQLAAQDATRAASLAAALPDGTVQDAALDVTIRVLVERDAGAAVQWALALPPEAARFAPLETLASILVARDAPGAAGKVLALPATSGRDELLTLVASRWARRDVSAALAWARDLPSGEVRTRMLTSIGVEVAQTDPQRAVAVVELLPEGRNRLIVLSAIGRTWVAKDRVAAFNWANALPAGTQRDAALSGIDAGLGATALHDVASSSLAGMVVTTNEARPRAPSYSFERDEALKRRFDDLMRASPAQAAQWLQSLPAADQHYDMMKQLTREWFAENPAAARQWLEETVISDAQKRQLLQDAGVPRPPR